MLQPVTVIGSLVLLLVDVTVGIAAAPPAAPTPTFNAHIRPILQAYCTECHGEAAKPKGGLDLRLRRFVVRGGDTGPAIVPGKSADSLLLQRVLSGEMPPGKAKLPKADVETLQRWVASGAKVEAEEPATLAAGFPITDEDRKYWAFQPVHRPEVPATSHGLTNPIDRFVQVRLTKQGLSLNPTADRVALIRRVTFDLTGLPPTPDEIDAFLADTSAEAYGKLVDRLLASTRYGERWGRHWLDIAGYADSEGGSSTDVVRTTAWKYRDYVIRAFNADMPFDRFIREQIAGDELAAHPQVLTDPNTIDKLIATGFLRTAADGSGAPGVDEKLVRNQVVTDTVKIVSSSFLGMTVGCAECHNHRYDPIPQTDFYRLRAILEPAYSPSTWKPPAARQVSLLTAADRVKAAAVEVEAAKIEKERLARQQKFIDATFDKEVAKLPEDLRKAAITARATPEAKRTAGQKKLMQEHPSLNVTASSLYLYDLKASDELKKLSDKATALRKTKPTEEFIRALTDSPGKAPPTHLYHRGDPDQPKEVVPPGGLAVLDSALPLVVPGKPLPSGSTGRRLALAQWLTDPRHPLTARVFVNRVWMHHFGRGLVATPGDFGRLGERPTHPALLDWLASEFVQSGWSLKKFHRLILTSATYRQSSARSPAGDAADPDNRLLWRYPVRRLDAEAIRDAALAVSGALNPKMFGPPVPVKENDAGLYVLGVDTKDGAGRFTGEVALPAGDEFRRSVYVQVRRSRPLATLDTFDWATTEPNCEARAVTTATPQSLMLLNGEFVAHQSEAFAARVVRDAGPDLTAQVARAWRLAYGPPPSAAQLTAARTFVAEQTAIFRAVPPPAPPKGKGAKPAESPSAETRAMASFCQALFASNRFLYVD